MARLLLLPVLTLAALACSRQEKVACPKVPCQCPTQGEPAADPSFLALEQWAASARASSQYAAGSWSAQNAAGAPDTAGCGDSTSAWAAEKLGGMEWIELTYATPVIPTRIDIHENNYPGRIVKVEVGHGPGELQTVWTSQPQAIGECPRILHVPVFDVIHPVDTVRITMDLTSASDWNEIDAVRLVGIPGQGEAQPRAPAQHDRRGKAGFKHRGCSTRPMDGPHGRLSG